MPTVTIDDYLRVAGSDRVESAVDPAAAHEELALIDGHDLPGGDGRLRLVEDDPDPAVLLRLDGGGDGPMPGPDLCQAGSRPFGRVDVPLEFRADQPRLLE